MTNHYLKMPCPVCDARTGHWCTGTTGHERRTAHDDRRTMRRGDWSSGGYRGKRSSRVRTRRMSVDELRAAFGDGRGVRSTEPDNQRRRPL